MTQQWRPIPGYEGAYEVSDLGRVRSVDRWIDYADGRRRLYRGRVLRLRPHPKGGHLLVSLAQNSDVQAAKVHALVMLAFVGPRPAGLDVCHGNGKPDDNRLSNLRYASHGENELDKVRHGTHKEARKTHCPQGHPYDEANTRVIASRPRARYCRACHKARRLAASSGASRVAAGPGSD